MPAAFTEQQKLNASDAQLEDWFGYSVSIDGDTLVVGARYEEPSGKTDAGSAYVFTRSGGVWTQQQKLNASDAASGDRFSHSVSIDGDTIVVGAPLEDPSGTSNAGSAYVLTRSGGVWTQQQKLNASDVADRDYFGYSVAISGDTVVVGAYSEDPGGLSNAGSAYVFTRSAGVWTQQQKLYASDAGAEDYFGFSVAIDGDTIIVGAYNEDPSSVSNAGSAYVFTRSGGVWTQQQKLNASDAEAGDYFGISVAIDGDTTIVGAYGEDPGGMSDAGSAYVFTRSAGVWTQQQKLNASDPGNSDYFGFSVAISGDTAIVGAYQEDPSSISFAGSAYVFTRSGGVWTQQQKLSASDAQVSDNFGFSVAISGDTAIVGAYNEDPGGLSNAGSAYIFTDTSGIDYVETSSDTFLVTDHLSRIATYQKTSGETLTLDESRIVDFIWGSAPVADVYDKRFNYTPLPFNLGLSRSTLTNEARYYLARAHIDGLIIQPNRFEMGRGFENPIWGETVYPSPDSNSISDVIFEGNLVDQRLLIDKANPNTLVLHLTGPVNPTSYPILETLIYAKIVYSPDPDENNREITFACSVFPGWFLTLDQQPVVKIVLPL